MIIKTKVTLDKSKEWNRFSPIEVVGANSENDEAEEEEEKPVKKKKTTVVEEEEKEKPVKKPVKKTDDKTDDKVLVGLKILCASYGIDVEEDDDIDAVTESLKEYTWETDALEEDEIKFLEAAKIPVV